MGFQERFECWNRDEFEPMREMYAEDAVFDVSAVFTDVAPMRLYFLRPEHGKVVRAQLFPGVEAAISAGESSASQIA